MVAEHTDAWEKFEKFLQQKQLKVTQERKIIVDCVFQDDDHFDAEELVNRLRQSDYPISRATVYRTLDLLTQSGLVKKYSFEENTHRYEHIYGHEEHSHLVCQKCGNIFEFKDEDVQEVVNKVTSAMNFKPSHHDFVVYGICEDCQKKTKH